MTVAHDLDHSLKRAVDFVEVGECSHASRELGSLGAAPSTPETYAESSDPNLRPPEPAVGYPVLFNDFVPVNDIALDYDIFAKILQQCRRGLRSGLGGGRCEYLKLVLDDAVGFQLLFYVCEKFANGDIPSEFVGALKLSKFPFLRKKKQFLKFVEFLRVIFYVG